MGLTPLFIRTLVYIIKMLAVIRGEGMISDEAAGLMRAWEKKLEAPARD